VSCARKSGQLPSVTFHLVNAQHKFDFILVIKRTSNEMPRMESDKLMLSWIQTERYPTLSRSRVPVSQEQHKHAPTGIPNITKNITPYNTLCTAIHHMIT